MMLQEAGVRLVNFEKKSNGRALNQQLNGVAPKHYIITPTQPALYHVNQPPTLELSIQAHGFRENKLPSSPL